MLSFLAALVTEVAVVRWIIGWTWSASLLAGVALAPTSIAIVYTVLVDTGMNHIPLGRRMLIACFLSNLAAMVLLGLVFTKPSAWLADIRGIPHCTSGCSVARHLRLSRTCPVMCWW